MHALVTGGAGHIGSHVVEQLLQKGYRVTSVDNYSNGSEENHIQGAFYIKGDSSDIDELTIEIPNVIYHLGEYARIAPSFDDRKKVFHSNCAGTQAILEYCIKHEVKLVYAASSTIFDHSLDSPYSFIKTQNVQLIKQYGIWFDLDYVICYFSNGFGPREKADPKYGTLVANLLSAKEKGQKMQLTAPSTQKRNFTYVEDLARGMILAGERGTGDGYVFANPTSNSILEIAQAIGGDFEIVEKYSGRASSGIHENMEEVIKASLELGWSPTLDVISYIKGRDLNVK